MQSFRVDMDRADSLSGGAGHPERPVLDYIKTNIHITSSRDAAGAPATPHPRLHQCRPVTDYTCHRPDATAIGQFFEAIPHLAEHAQTACGNAEALFRLAWSQPPTLPPAGAARTPNPDDCGRPPSGHTERSDLRPPVSHAPPSSRHAERRVRVRPKPRRQSRYVIRLPVILAELCRIVHR